jgi:hypothetical protein
MMQESQEKTDNEFPAAAEQNIALSRELNMTSCTHFTSSKPICLHARATFESAPRQVLRDRVFSFLHVILSETRNIRTAENGVNGRDRGTPLRGVPLACES